MNLTICDAISKRLVLHLYYEGGFRDVEPFCHGISTAGNEVLRCYQIGGHSNSGHPIDWKLFVVSKISNLTTTKTPFSSNRPGYNPNDKGMSSVHCHV